MVNPFDWRTVALAKHAQHVGMIHFPIALFLVGVFFDVIAVRTRNQEFASVAFFNVSAAAIAVIPALVTGLLAWQWQLEGQPVKGVLLYHMLSAGSSALVLVLAWWVHFRARRRTKALPVWRIPLELAGVVLVALTGHLGGFLSGVNG